MRRILVLLVAMVSLALVGASTVAVPEAHAVVGARKVRNSLGNSVLVRCNYSSDPDPRPYSGRLYEYRHGDGKGAHYPYIWHSDDVSLDCRSDTDQFRAEWDDRCMEYRGPGYTDGFYKLHQDTWFKVSDLAHVTIYNWTYGGKCNGRPWFNHK